MMPMTRPAPFEEVPVIATGMDTLFPELAPNGYRPVEVTATVPDGDRRRALLHIVIAEADAPKAFGLACGLCNGLPDFEVTAVPFKGRPLQGQ